LPDPLPRLRPLDARPMDVRGRQMVVVRDPAGYAEGAWCLEPVHYFVASLFDGERTVLDVQAEYSRHVGQLLLSDEVERVAAELDELHLMETERFAAYRRERQEEFHAVAVREAVGAGAGYPEGPDDIRLAFDGYLADAGPAPGPGAPRGVMAPHIDFERGGRCYGHAYAHLRDADPGALFVVLGVAHGPMDMPFAVTDKAFQTPLGLAQADSEFIHRLADESGLPLFHDEWAHRNEHSIEFQVLWLQHLLGDQIRIAPILCGSFEPVIGPDGSPGECEPIRAFTDALGRLVAEHDGPMHVVAGVDLAHVGPEFGDAQPLGPEALAEAEAEDRQMLERVTALDAEGFYLHVMRDANARRICGLTAIYTFLKAGAFREGRLVHYEQAVRDDGANGVTFASAVFD